MEVTSVSFTSVNGPQPPPDDLRKSILKGERVLYINPTGIPFGSSGSAFIKNIKRIVAKDMKQTDPSKRIDAISIGPTNERQPDSTICVALDGLSPKILHIWAGWDEGCSVIAFQDTKSWAELQVLSLDSMCSVYNEEHGWPTCFSRLPELTLNYCCGLIFQPPGGAENLRKLTILENDATSMFSSTIGKNPKIRETLESLNIKSTNGCDWGSSSFKERLKKCTKIKDLTLALAGKNIEIGLSPYLPASTESLVFQGPPTTKFLENLDEWIDQAKKGDWLPNLKTFTLKFGWGDLSRHHSRNDPTVVAIPEPGGDDDQDADEEGTGHESDEEDVPGDLEGDHPEDGGVAGTEVPGDDEVDEDSGASDDDLHSYGPGDRRAGEDADLDGLKAKRTRLYDILETRNPPVLCVEADESEAVPT